MCGLARRRSGFRMADDVKLTLGAIFQGSLPGGLAGMLRSLRGLGAARVGRDAPRLAMDAAIEIADLFAYLDTAWVDSERGWIGLITLAPYTAVNIIWPQARGGTLAAIRELYDRVVALGDVEFAAFDEFVDVGRFAPRATLLAYFDGERYAERGPATLGAGTLLGNRVLALLEPELRDALVAAGRLDAKGLALGGEEWLTTEDGRAQRQALAARFEDSAAIMQRTFDDNGIGHPTPGPAWVPPPPGPPPIALPRKTTAALKKLKAGAHDLELPGLVAPFSRLTGIKVVDIELEQARLPLTNLRSALLREVGAYGADLRGIEAVESQWIESTLERADLRWADFTHARFPLTSLEHANAEHAVFKDAQEIERAEHACFDHILGSRWAPDAPQLPAILTGATFRGAVLDGARFVGTRLDDAIFDEADLTDATFTGASLRGTSFRGSKLVGTVFMRCNLDGAHFDPGAEPKVIR